MRARTALLCIFFVAAQVAIFFVVKRSPSFAEAKWLLVYLEGLVVLLTTGIYLGLQPAAPQVVAPPVVKEVPSQVPALQRKIEELQQTVQKLEETAVFSQQHIQRQKEEQVALQKKMHVVDEQLADAKGTVDACCLAIHELGGDFEQVVSQIEQERRQHAIEVRTLLGKNYSAAREEKKAAKIPLSPLPAALVFLLTCQKAQGPDSTAALLRRKCFDVARQFGTSPLALASLHHPTEYFLSPRLAQQIAPAEFLAAIDSHKDRIEKLQPFQPYKFSDVRLGAFRWTAFRLVHEHLDDLVVVVPHAAT